MADEDTDHMSAQPEEAEAEARPGLLDILRERPLTVVDLVEDGTPGRKEIIDGGLFVSPLGDVAHQAMVMDLALALHAMCPREGLRVFPGVNVTSGPRTLVIPDVVVADAGATGLALEPGHLALVVEVTSPTARRRDLTIKRELYREWKVPFVIVDRGQTPAEVVVEGDLPEWFDPEPLRVAV